MQPNDPEITNPKSVTDNSVILNAVDPADGNDYAIALRRKVDFVGKRNKRSKVCVFWAFQSRRGSKFRHEVRRLFYFLFL